MKIHNSIPPNKSKSSQRVIAALAHFAPKGIDIVDDLDKADMVIIHVVGRQDWLKRHIMQINKPFALIQYCIRSTMRPSTEGWLPLWKKANVVWSYLDLKALCVEDGQKPIFPFYHAPLGVDSKIFKPSKVTHKRFIIGTSGLSYMTESVREAMSAAQRRGEKVFHLGPTMGISNVVSANNISDRDLADYYRQCIYVSGLRRVEGFELPAAEGLCCGARPVLFDRPHYRKWYGDWAEYISEGDRLAVIDDLEKLFQSKRRSVARVEMKAAKRQFDWQTIAKGFWERCLA